MNYLDLKVIMAYIKNKISCPDCKKKYKDHGLNIVETFSDSCTVVGLCFKCKKPSLIEVTILPERIHRPIKDDRIHLKTINNTPITESEIVELREFLQNFNGDFKTLFTKKS